MPSVGADGVVRQVATELVTELGDGMKRPAVNDIGLEGVEEQFHLRVLTFRDFFTPLPLANV